MGVETDCQKVVQQTISSLGGLDILISNAGYTRFSDFSDLSATTLDDWDRTYAVNVKAQVYLLRAARETFNANAEGGAMIITSSIAGRTTAGSSMPYSVSKAAQIHLMRYVLCPEWERRELIGNRCLASTQGPKVRVNAVLPGFLRTEWVSWNAPVGEWVVTAR